MKSTCLKLFQEAESLSYSIRRVSSILMNLITVGLLSATFLTNFPVGSARAEADKPEVYLIRINGVINPISADFIIKNISRAEEQNAACLVIEMDTPGGLMESTKDIVKKMLASRIPVVVYVSPSGSGAVSAGVFITMAANIAVMAEGTNIGAAHPVGLGGQQDTSKVMNEKVTNWAAAYMRSIAEKRGRNADWAEESVRKSVSVTERVAVQKKIVDYVCPTLDSLLTLIDGKEVEVATGKVVLHTKGATLLERQMGFRYKILYKISDPTIAYILLILGIYGLFFELSSPGAILPGVVGGIFLILAFFALQTLPINYAGLLLILFAIVLFLLEIKVTSYGILTIGGVVSMIIGSLMLIESPVPALRISLSVIIAAAITTAAFFVFALGMALKAKRAKPTTGKEGLIGEKGVALTKIAPEGEVKLHGEIWKAQSDVPIQEGEKIRVVAVEGLELRVTKAG